MLGIVSDCDAALLSAGASPAAAVAAAGAGAAAAAASPVGDFLLGALPNGSPDELLRSSPGLGLDFSGSSFSRDSPTNADQAFADLAQVGGAVRE